LTAPVPEQLPRFELANAEQAGLYAVICKEHFAQDDTPAVYYNDFFSRVALTASSSAWISSSFGECPVMVVAVTTKAAAQTSNLTKLQWVTNENLRAAAPVEGPLTNAPAAIFYRITFAATKEIEIEVTRCLLGQADQKLEKNGFRSIDGQIADLPAMRAVAAVMPLSMVETSKMARRMGTIKLDKASTMMSTLDQCIKAQVANADTWCNLQTPTTVRVCAPVPLTWQSRSDIRKEWNAHAFITDVSTGSGNTSAPPPGETPPGGCSIMLKAMHAIDYDSFVRIALRIHAEARIYKYTTTCATIILPTTLESNKSRLHEVHEGRVVVCGLGERI
jgi:hypothetical protein